MPSDIGKENRPYHVTVSNGPNAGPFLVQDCHALHWGGLNSEEEFMHYIRKHLPKPGEWVVYVLEWPEGKA